MESCRKRRLLTIPALVLGLTTAVFSRNDSGHDSGAAAESRPPVSVLIARPSDASFGRGQKDLWVSALIEQMLHFKLGAVPGLSVFPHDSLFTAIPRFGDLTRDLRKDRYLALARSRKIDLLLIMEYELIKERDVACLFEVVSVSQNKPVLSLETTFPITGTAQFTDSSISRFLSQLKIEPDRTLSFFLRLPSVGDNARNLRQLGSVIISEKYTEQSDPATAGQEYHRIVERDPGMHLANFLGANAFLNAKSYANAALMFDRLLLAIGAAYPRLYIECSQSYRRARRFDDALRIALLAERNGLGSTELTALRAAILRDRGDEARARELFSTISQQDARDPYSLLFFAQQNNRDGDHGKALELSNRLLSIRANDAGGYLERGRALLGLGRHTEAGAALTRASQLATDDPVALILLGDIALKQNRFTEASRLYPQALALTTGDLTLRLKAADALERSGQTQSALRILREAAPAQGRNPEVQKRMGLLEYALGDSSRARRNLEAYTQAGNTREYDVLAALGDLYLRAGLGEQALRMYTFALPLAPDKNPVRLALAKLHLQDSAFSQANIHLQDILSATPSYPGANRLRGDAYLMEGKPQDALRHYETERNRGDKSPELQAQIAHLRYILKDWKTAQREYLVYVKLRSDEPEAYRRLALIALQLGAVQEAEGYLRKAMALGGTDTRILLEFGNRYREMKRYASASETYNQALVLSPGNIEALQGLARVYEAWGRDSAAATVHLSLFEVDKQANRDNLLSAARLFLKAGDTHSAERAYGMYPDLQGRPDVRISAARLKFSSGKHSEVIVLLEPLDRENDEEIILIYAQSCMHAGREAQAIAPLSRLLERNASNRQALELLARALEKTGDLKQAASIYERYLALPRTQRHPEFAYTLARLHETLNQPAQARRRYERNLKAYPTDSRSFERLGEIHLEAREYQAAIAVLRQGISIPGASPNMKNLLAQALAGARDRKGAIRYYTDYLKSAPNDTAALLDLGRIHFSQKEFSEAIPVLKRALDNRAGGFDALHMIGISYLHTERPGEAVPFLRKALDKDPRSIPAVSALVDAYRRLKESANLTAALKTWADLDSANHDVQRETGHALYAGRKPDLSLPYLHRAVGAKPSDHASHLLIAEIYRAQGKEDLRVYHLSMAVRASPDQFAPHYELGRFHTAKADHDRAIMHLKRAVELDADHAGAAFLLGSALLSRSDHRGAIPYLSRAVKASPDSARYELMLAQAYYHTGNTASALASIRRAVSLQSRNGEILYWAGLLHFQTRHYDSARQYFKSAASINRKCLECHEYLGDIARMKKDHTTAAAEYRRASRLAPDNSRLMYKMGRAYYESGQASRARQAMDRVARPDSTNHEALYLAGSLSIKRGAAGRAEKMLQEREGGRKTGWLFLLSGELNESRNRPHEAFLDFSAAARMLPDNAAAHSGLGRAFLYREDYSNALQCFTRALSLSPDDPAALIGAGLAHAGRKNNTDALKMLYKGTDGDPHHAHAFSVIGAIESRRGNRSRAIEAYRKAVKAAARDAHLHMALGREYKAASRYRDALSSFRSAARLGGNEFRDAHKSIGDIYYESLKQREKAKIHYERYVKAGGTDAAVKRRLSRL